MFKPLTMRPVTGSTLLAGLLVVLAACGQAPGTQTASTAPSATQPTTSGSVARALDVDPYLIDPFTIGTGADKDSVQATLEGCRNDGTITLPNGAGKFICPDGAYTTGNLGKGWNELDLVPHRVTVKAGNSAPATQTYTLGIVMDNQDAGAPGYDVLSVPVLNTAKSDAACVQPSYSKEQYTTNFGGIDKSVFRLLKITQAKNTSCVYDYYARLALGSHLFPGSSLHANLASKDLTTAGIGARDVSIPVKEIKPQEISKDMTASQGRDQVWDITKKPNPATVNFGDVCSAQGLQDQSVKITIAWEIKQVVPGNVTLITHVYATNPASRVITVNVTDRIYRGSDQTTLIDTASSGEKDVPANTTNFLMLTHTFNYVTTEDLFGALFNDVATGTYTDKVTGIAVPGNTSAAASATVTKGTLTNASADISDSESITGPDLTFAVATPSLGSFSNYIPGTFVTGPVDWSVTGQTAGGSVDFNKLIRLASKSVVNGTLSDTASLSGSDGASASASASIDISSTASVSLTIQKRIPDVLQGTETQTFNFLVSQVGQPDRPVTITFNAGDTVKTVTVNNLQPGDYTVTEQTASGWQAVGNTSVPVGLNLPTCAGSASFENKPVPASARVRKVTNPAGSEAGWQFTLKGPGIAPEGETVTTSDAGFVTFTSALQEGTYTITETPRDGWDLTDTQGCTINVNFPTDAAKVFECVATNTQRGKIIVKKETDPKGSDQAFTFTSNFSGNFDLKDGGQNESIWLAPKAGYSVSETVPSGWQQTSATCSDGSLVGNIDLAAGETVTCTFKNMLLPKLTVIKVVVNEFGGTKQVSDFTLKVNANTVTSGVTGTYQPGSYSVSEVMPLPYGYTQDSLTGDCDASGNVTLAAGDNKTCTITNSDSPGTIVVIKNAKPGNGNFAFATSGTDYLAFTLSGDPTGGANINTQTNLKAGGYTVQESTQLGWLLTGIGGSSDPNTPYNCVVTGKGGSSGLGDLNTQTATITLMMGDTVTCIFENTGQGVTRTQGFWATHPNLALIAWTGGTLGKNSFPGVSSVSGIGDMMLCGRPVSAGNLLTPASSDLMGSFWSDIAKTSVGAKRSALDQARMQLLQQMMAAQLNASAFGSVPAGGSAMFAQWEAAYCGTNTTAIKNAQQQAASFNTAGDSGTFTPGTSADSKTARLIANYVRWNVLP